MRYLLFIIYFFLMALTSFGQGDQVINSGKVSYITSQNVYVRFETTEEINIGDTLFSSSQGKLIPALIVGQKSSISCVCTAFSGVSLQISDEIFANNPKNKDMLQTRKGTLVSDKPNDDDLNLQQNQVNLFDTSENDDQQSSRIKEKISNSSKSQQEIHRSLREQISGRVSLSSYNTFSQSKENHRMRYRLALRGDHLGNTRLSMDSYITFRHTLDKWEEVQNNLNNALKIYSLSFRYDFSNSSSLSIGRKINPKISSMGAIDGIQYEQGIGNFQLGVLVGSRPDYFDYSLNLHLFQYGAYASHEFRTETKFMQNTIGFIEQRNNSKIDRRFIYYQHNSALTRNLYFFASAEISLYENLNEQPKNVFDLSNLYASLRYRFSKKLSASISYDNRKNVQYYETFKNFIDQLIEQETRQGLRFNVNYRLLPNIIWGVNAGWRFQKSKKNLSENVNSYLTFSRIPALGIRTTLTANLLQTNYLHSKIFGVRISRELIPGKLDGNINYRMVDYRYLNYESVTRQNLAGINLSWNIIRKLTLYMDYEGTFDHQNMLYHRFYGKLIQRF